jgi:hypothetical protein
LLEHIGMTLRECRVPRTRYAEHGKAALEQLFGKRLAETMRMPGDDCATDGGVIVDRHVFNFREG